MDKKKIIFWVVIALIVIGVLLFVNLSSFEVYITAVLSFIGGTVIGWFVRTWYVKYILNK